MSKYGVISGPYFPIFSPNTRKYGPEITPYLDSFLTVTIFIQSSRPEVFCEISVKFFRTPILKNICERLLVFIKTINHRSLAGPLQFSHQLFYDGGPYHIETSPLISFVNQWTGFYMIGTSVISELIFAFAIFSLLKYFVKLIGKQLWWWPIHLKSSKQYWVIFLIDKIIEISSRYSFCKPHIFYERLDKTLNCLYYWKVHSQVWDNFWQVKVLLNWWKMLIISHWKLF